MDFNYIATLLGIIHSAQEVDTWFVAQARAELNAIKAEHSPKPEPVVPAASPAPAIDPEVEGLEKPKPNVEKRSL